MNESDFLKIFTIIFSNSFEEKLRLSFKMYIIDHLHLFSYSYDLNNDGLINQEDVRSILTCILS
jgi:hypothetical protein